MEVNPWRALFILMEKKMFLRFCNILSIGYINFCRLNLLHKIKVIDHIVKYTGTTTPNGHWFVVARLMIFRPLNFFLWLCILLYLWIFDFSTKKGDIFGFSNYMVWTMVFVIRVLYFYLFYEFLKCDLNNWFIFLYMAY